MVDVSFYFQVHQPYRLREYSVFDIGRNHKYFDDKKNREIIERVVKKAYLPANSAFMDLIRQHGERFKISFSITGVLIEQLRMFSPETLESFRELAETGNVEFLSETYYHSLASLFSPKEFREQVMLHKRLIKEEFGITPRVFRNTEVIFSDKIADMIKEMGFKSAVAEGADKIMEGRSPNYVYEAHNGLKLLLKNYMLSDDIAFRFSNREWNEWPLTAEKYSSWLDGVNGNGEIINLFMDYETFGEHQWAQTGIFKFLRKMPEIFLKKRENRFVTVSEALSHEPRGRINFPYLVSWADTERDVSAWLGNDMQKTAAKEIYAIERTVRKSRNKEIIRDWRKLQVSDNFYYMCTKWFSDGDVHKYFNPYSSPYEGFIAFMNILNDIMARIKGEINIPLERPSRLLGQNKSKL